MAQNTDTPTFAFCIENPGQRFTAGNNADGDTYVIDSFGRMTGLVTSQDVATAALTETLGR